MTFRIVSQCLLVLIIWPHQVLATDRIVSLSPHLTEWIYSLGLEDNLVAVSAYSDYPNAAKIHPIVADFQGVNFNALLQKKPTLVLVWQGGNKPQDIARLQSLGMSLFFSSPHSPEDIANEIVLLGNRTGTSQRAESLAAEFIQQLATLRSKHAGAQPIPVFYYSWQTPLMTIGENAWANKLLNICGAYSIFAQSPTDYPTVSLQQVLVKNPSVIVNATGSSTAEAKPFWQPHRNVFEVPIVSANTDILSRFTLRLLPELNSLCESIHQVATNK